MSRHRRTITYAKTGELVGLNGTFNLYSVTGDDPERLAREAEEKRSKAAAAKQQDERQTTLPTP